MSEPVISPVISLILLGSGDDQLKADAVQIMKSMGVEDFRIVVEIRAILQPLVGERGDYK
ncbi:MAG: hypothetical protein Q7J72_01860 [Candidatus Omnitrophota bacterium]|nr:hypothetical protein [Candidatus Omnitrophota bacterium]